ncbi:MAG: trimeric intracellular cation channel family protein [Bacteroidia bacterium]|nr:trimeric intracellular cation channel family protein [Bacteroidia bacterium]
MEYLLELNINRVFDFLGTVAFALSGIRLASAKQFDWFGAYVIGFVTAIGGGTVRDLLLDVTPFWMIDPAYLVLTGIALLASLLFKHQLFSFGKTLFLFDTIGLGLFTMVGLEKSLEAGLPFWTCIIMGAITGALGGVIRDTLINEIPLLFRKDIYALASFAGGAVYFVCIELGVADTWAFPVAAVSVIAIRTLAVKFHIHLPNIQNLDSKAE